MRIEVVCTGEELLLGLTENTSFGEIARSLREAGHDVVGGRVVGDGLEAIRDAILAAADRAEAVVVTGGLGPTRDDRTREAAAAAAGVPLEFREDQLAVIEVLFRDRGREPPAGNRVQAMFPSGADVIANPLGTAPGFEVPVRDARVFALSGVPRETRVMLEHGVIPRIGDRATPVTVRRLRVFGLPEAELDRSLGRLMSPDAEPLMGVTSKGAVHTLTVASRLGAEAGRAAVDERVALVRGILGDLVFGRDDDRLEEVVARELARTGLTIAVAESCTGGFLAARLVDVPGMSAHLVEGVVAYANEAKVRRLGVRGHTLTSAGAVSPRTAIEMAEGIRRAASADVGVSTTGIAGPEGGSPDKPVGLVYTGVAVADRVWAARHVHFGDRRMIRDRATKTALDLLRRSLSRVRR